MSTTDPTPRPDPPATSAPATSATSATATSSSASKSSRPSRRAFLGTAAATAVGVGGAAWVATRDRERWPSVNPNNPGTGPSQSNDPDAPPFEPITVAAPLEKRTLVVIELDGGNDGLATLVPYNNGSLRDLRPNLMRAPEDLVILNDDFGLHPALGDLNEQGLAIIQGVGVPDPSGSHFGMQKRWWSGQSEGQSNTNRSGFLGRLCDQLDTGDPITGVTIGGRRSLALTSEKAVTAALTDTSTGWYLTAEGEWFQNLRTGIAAMGAPEPEGPPLRSAARHGLKSSLAFNEIVSKFADNELEEYENGGNLGWPLAVASTILESDIGVRVIHVPFGGFDTHENQLGGHDYLMEQLGISLAAFERDLAAKGLADSTLIATASEFGRRPEENASGTDHGEASIALLAGPVVPGLHGESASLSRLSATDNLDATVTMGEYYATLAAWFDVPPTEVLDGSHAPLAEILR